MKAAIVTCATANWLHWAAATLLSAHRNQTSPAARLVVCCAGAGATERSALAAFCQRHQCEIELIDVPHFEVAPALLDRVGIGTLIRLKLDALLQADFDRVLYLDADTLVEQPLGPLFGTDFGGCPVAAAADVGLLSFMNKVGNARNRAMGFERDGDYFNAGVFLMDWAVVRDKGVLPDALACLNDRPDLPFADQDALNLVLKGRWKRLDQRWNLMDWARMYTPAEPCIVHFGPHKPWTARRLWFEGRYLDYYREAFRDTPLQGRAIAVEPFAHAIHAFRDWWRINTRPASVRAMRAFISVGDR